MPIKKGSSNKTRAENIKEMVTSFKAKGSIGNTRPGSLKKASQIAAAIAYKNQRKARKG